jgi:cell division protein FtsQ
MPRVSAPPPKPARRPPGPPPRRTEPRDMKDRPRGWVLALRRQRRRVRPTLYLLAALALTVSVAAVVHASSHAASLTSLRQRFGELGAAFGLRVQTIVVQGRAMTPEPLLNAAIGVDKGDPLLGYSVADARARIVTLASVQDATVERRWPSTILVSLTERHAFAVWQHDGRFMLIDRDGSLLADQDVRLAGLLPLVVGNGAPAHAAELLDAVAAHKEIQAHLVAAVRVSDRRWNLHMTSGADVLLPEDGQAGALDRLDALQATHRLLDRRLQVIDLRLTDRTTLRPAT